MKKLVLIALTTLLGTMAQARTGGPFGLGLVLGEPTALTLKYDQSENDAFDAGLAFNFDKWVLVYGDYQYKFAGAIRTLPQFTPYIGIGAVIVGSNRSIDDTRHYQYFTSSTDSKWALGVRVPLGIEWRPNAPIGVFAEIAPGISLIPSTTSFIQGGVGIRYFF
jgi:hypothetical protein